MAVGIKVRGADELAKAFLELRREVLTELKPALVEAAEPVRHDAIFLAQEQIRNIGPVWSQMRVGVTSQIVYVAPRARRRGGSPRPNLAGLLMNRAMEPALKQNEEKVMLKLDALVQASAARQGFF